MKPSSADSQSKFGELSTEEMVFIKNIAYLYA